MSFAGVKKGVDEQLLALTKSYERKLLFKCLKVLVMHQRLNKQQCQILIDKIIAKVRAWPL